jgi:hypothetical protein
MDSKFEGDLNEIINGWEYCNKNNKVEIVEVIDPDNVFRHEGLKLVGFGNYYARLRNSYFSVDLSSYDLSYICSEIDCYLVSIHQITNKLEKTLPPIVKKALVGICLDGVPLLPEHHSVLIDALNNPEWSKVLTDITNKFDEGLLEEHKKISFFKNIIVIAVFGDKKKYLNYAQVSKNRADLAKGCKILLNSIQRTKTDPELHTLLFGCQSSKQIPKFRKKTIQRFVSAIDSNKFAISLQQPPKLSEMLFSLIHLIEEKTPTQRIALEEKVASVNEVVFGSKDVNIVAARQLLLEFEKMFGHLPRNAWEFHALIFPNRDKDASHRDYRRWKGGD